MGQQGDWMRIAALYDIHANLPALRAVLKEVDEAGADRIIVGGDVLPGPLPRETLDVLQTVARPSDFISGNGDHDTIAALHGDDISRVPPRYRGLLLWTAQQLAENQREMIANWPATLETDHPDHGRIVFCHATPRDDNELFTIRTAEEKLRPIFEATRADLVVCGHTHMQFDRRIGRVRAVNAGSVGLPFGSPGAHWLLIGETIELRQTSYDLDAAMSLFGKTTYPRLGEFDVTERPSEADMLAALERRELTP